MTRALPMSREVVGIAPDEGLRAAAETMRSSHVGALVVVDQPDGERMSVGIITAREID